MTPLQNIKEFLKDLGTTISIHLCMGTKRLKFFLATRGLQATFNDRTMKDSLKVLLSSDTTVEVGRELFSEHCHDTLGTVGTVVLPVTDLFETSPNGVSKRIGFAMYCKFNETYGTTIRWSL